MIAVPMAAGGVGDYAGTYPGDMYAPVTEPNAVSYALQPPSTAAPAQVAPSPTTVPLNTYVATVSPSAVVAPVASSALLTNGCGCERPLRWYEIASAIALVVIAIAVFRK